MTSPAGSMLSCNLEETVLNVPLSYWRSLVLNRVGGTLRDFIGSQPLSLQDFVYYLYGLGQAGPSNEAWSELFEACHSASITSPEDIASLLVYATNTHVLTLNGHDVDSEIERDASVDDSLRIAFVQNTLRPALFGSSTCPELPGILCVVRRTWNEWMYGPVRLRATVCAAVTRSVDLWSVAAHITLADPGKALCHYVWKKSVEGYDATTSSLCSDVSSGNSSNSGNNSNNSSSIGEPKESGEHGVLSLDGQLGPATSLKAAVSLIGTRIAMEEVARLLGAHAAVGVVHSGEVHLELLEFANSKAEALLCDKVWTCRRFFVPISRPTAYEDESRVCCC
jgi:hypothetical protein